MVTIDKQNQACRFTLSGDEHQYFGTLRALARLIACQDKQTLEKETIYYAATLIEEMLPDPEQTVSMRIE